MVVQNGGFYRQIQAVFRYHKYIKFLFFPTEGTMLVADWMEQKISQWLIIFTLFSRARQRMVDEEL